MIESNNTRTRLLEAAGRVFAEMGYAGATVRDICGRAGANVAAVNYYFGDKEQLYRAALRHAFQCRLEQLPVPQWPEGTPPVAKLREFIRSAVTHMLGDRMQPWQMQLLTRSLAFEPSPASQEVVQELIRPVYQTLWSLLREALPGGVSEEQLHLIGFSIVGQAFYHRTGRAVLAQVVGEEEYARYEAARLAEHIADFSLAALGLRPPLGGEGVAS